MRFLREYLSRSRLLLRNNIQQHSYSYQIITWLPAFIFLIEYGYSTTAIRGLSMSPTFTPDEKSAYCVLLKKFGIIEQLERGQVVVYRSPLNPERIIVKRIIGMDHDIVKTNDNFPLDFCEVPEGHVWVEGDCQEESYDSNNYGPISKNLIIAKVTRILWPFDKFGMVEHFLPEATRTRVEPPPDLQSTRQLLSSS